MKRRRKIFYLVKRVNTDDVWFYKGKWYSPDTLPEEYSGGMSDTKHFRTFNATLKHCYNLKPGTVHIMRFYHYKGVRYCRDYFL